MPLYDYYCPNCKTEFTRIRPITASAKNAECDKGHRAIKVVTLPAATLIANGANSQNPNNTPTPQVTAGCACGRGSCGCGAN